MLVKFREGVVEEVMVYTPFQIYEFPDVYLSVAYQYIDAGLAFACDEEGQPLPMGADPVAESSAVKPRSKNRKKETAAL
jgi:hypothetical protein